MDAEVVRQKAGGWMQARGWRQKLAKGRPHACPEQSRREPSKIRRFGIYVRRGAPRGGLQGTLRPVAGRP